MLKLKDNIDLKELEKFGFKEREIEYIYESEEGVEVSDDFEYSFTPHITNHTFFNIYVYKDNRILEVEILQGYENITTEELPVLLYDLIQAGLVEKLEE